MVDGGDPQFHRTPRARLPRRPGQESLDEHVDWDSSVSPVDDRGDFRIMGTRAAADGPVGVTVWRGEPHRLFPHVLHRGVLPLRHGCLLIHDPDEDVRVLVRYLGRGGKTAVLADRPEHPTSLEIVLSCRSSRERGAR